MERTSFAECEEEKGFFELRITRRQRTQTSPSAQRAAIESTFVPLPARPMVDVDLLATDQQSAHDEVERVIEQVPPRALVRVRTQAAVASTLRIADLRAMAQKRSGDSIIVELHPRRPQASR